MKLVIIESPYAGEIERNTHYARAAMHDCLCRGEAPLASHLLYTQEGILDDAKPLERALGIAAGFAWGGYADAVVFYTDFGMSEGMRRAKEVYERQGVKILIRTIPQWEVAANLRMDAKRCEEATS